MNEAVQQRSGEWVVGPVVALSVLASVAWNIAHRDPEQSTAREQSTTAELSPANQKPLYPITMGGYQEDHDHAPEWHSWVEIRRAQYLKDKAELEAALRTCASSPSSCDPRLKAFADMIEQARHIQSPLARIQLVNAWVNTVILYDHQQEKAYMEGRPDARPPRSLLDTIKDGMEVCDGYSRLKLAALEMLGHNPDDIRYIWIGYFVDNKFYTTERGIKVTHAFVEARAEGKNWILDNNTPLLPPDALLDEPRLKQQIAYTSRVESDAAKLNVTGASFMWSKHDRFQPIGEFSSTQSANYITHMDDMTTLDPDPPQVARTALAETTDLGLTLGGHDIAARLAQQIMASAFSIHYTLSGQESSIAEQNTGQAIKDAPSPLPGRVAAREPVRPSVAQVRESEADNIPYGSNTAKRLAKNCSRGIQYMCR